MRRLALALGGATVLLAPSVALAALSSLQDVADTIASLTETVVALIVAIALVLYLFGFVRALLNDGPKARQQVKQQAIWGIIAMFVLVSCWGIALLIARTFF